MYQSVFCDLDGTLFTDSTNISPENDRAIRAMTEKGVLFVPNTGRTYTEVPESVREHPCVRYLICSDGAAIYDKKTGKRISICMPQAVSAAVLDVLADYDISLSVRQNGYCYVATAAHNDEDYIAHNADAEWRYFFYLNSVPVEDFKSFCYGAEALEMICAFFASEAERQSAIARLSALAEVQVASTAPHNIEIFSTKAGKGNALLVLADELGISRAATIAVGDTTNDTDMLKKAGLGLAVENAYPALKAVADAVICPNTAHAVAYIYNHYIK